MSDVFDINGSCLFCGKTVLGVHPVAVRVYCSAACKDAYDVAEALTTATCVTSCCEKPARGGKGTLCVDHHKNFFRRPFTHWPGHRREDI